jgi:hypothetical protein
MQKLSGMSVLPPPNSQFKANQTPPAWEGRTRHAAVIPHHRANHATPHIDPTNSPQLATQAQSTAMHTTEPHKPDQQAGKQERGIRTIHSDYQPPNSSLSLHATDHHPTIKRARLCILRLVLLQITSHISLVESPTSFLAFHGWSLGCYVRIFHEITYVIIKRRTPSTAVFGETTRPAQPGHLSFFAKIKSVR